MNNFRRIVIGLVIQTFLCGMCAPTFGQELDEATLRERLRTSVERLKWDKKQGRAIDKDVGKKNAAVTRESGEFRVRTELVNFDLTVLDKSGKPVSGFSQEQLEVYEDRVKQPLSFFRQERNKAGGLSIILILDLSDRLDFQISGWPGNSQLSKAERLIDLLAPADEMAIITADIRLICSYTSDKEQLKRHLLQVERDRRDRGNSKMVRTFQLDALVSSLREMMQTEREHPIIILQSDGDQLPRLRDKVCGKRLYSVLTVQSASLFKFPKDFTYASTDVST